MKNIHLFFYAVFLFTLMSCGGSKNQENVSLSLVWEMGRNQIEPGHYENTFSFVNDGKSELGNDWIVYFCQLPTKAKPDSLSPIIMEQISSTFFKMYPSPNYKPIAAGDTLKVTFICSGGIIKETNAPEGAYWVRLDKEGKESAPQNVALKVIPFTHDYQWSRTGVSELPYPDGEYVYDQNKYYIEEKQILEKTDIFPSLKSVVNKEGEFSFTKNVNLKYDASLSNEGDLLKEKLQSLYGCTVGAEGETSIELVMVANKEIGENADAYQIDMNNGKIAILATTPQGIFYGSKTLLQLLGSNSLPYNLPNTHISDFSDLKHRGLMLDVSRNFTNKENVLKIIDILSSYKMNVLHFHLSDDEGWRVEINGLEELTTVGAHRGHTLDESTCLYPAYASGWNPNSKTSLGNGFYTRAEFIEILKYAKSRHIRVMPEFDFPGHARAAIKAMNARYKKYIDTDKAKAEEYLLVDFDDKSVYSTAQEYTDNVINVAAPSTYRFIEKVIMEMNAMYTDAGLKMDVFHLGGDEVPHGAWEKSPQCMAFMKENNMKEIRELKDYFIQKSLDILKKNNIRLAAWQEVALLPDETPNKRFANENILSNCWNTVPEWKGDQIPYSLANNGYPVILSNVTNLYLDMSYNKHQKEPGLHWGGYVNEYNTFDMLPYEIYKSVRRDLNGNLVDIYKVSKEKVALKKEARKQIEGIQGHLFAETIRSFEQVEYCLFPKMFGLAERAWNAEPEWAKSDNDAEYKKAVQHYNSKIAEIEIPRLAWMQLNFRIAQPGMKLIDGFLHMNSTLPKAKIHYTTDGSEPTTNSALWTEPVHCDAKTIKAKAFYCGKESLTTLYTPNK